LRRSARLVVEGGAPLARHHGSKEQEMVGMTTIAALLLVFFFLFALFRWYDGR
jgi:hypothetical protein